MRPYESRHTADPRGNWFLRPVSKLASPLRQCSLSLVSAGGRERPRHEHSHAADHTCESALGRANIAYDDGNFYIVEKEWR